MVSWIAETLDGFVDNGFIEKSLAPIHHMLQISYIDGQRFGVVIAIETVKRN